MVINYASVMPSHREASDPRLYRDAAVASFWIIRPVYRCWVWVEDSGHPRPDHPGLGVKHSCLGQSGKDPEAE